MQVTNSESYKLKEIQVTGEFQQDSEIYLQELNQIPTGNIGEKSPWPSSRERKKRNHTFWPQRKQLIRSLSDLGKNYRQTPAHASRLLPIKGRKMTLRNVRKFTVWRHRLTNDCYLISGLQSTSPLSPLTTSLQGSLQQFLLPVHHAWLSRKKLQGIPKGKNTIWKDRTSIR